MTTVPFSNAQPQPNSQLPYPFSYSDTAAMAYGALQSAQRQTGLTGVGLGPNNINLNSNALCVTSRPGALIQEKCYLAISSHDHPTNKCGEQRNYLVSSESDNLPPGGMPTTCDANTTTACCPPGSVAVLCGGQRDQGEDYVDMTHPGSRGLVPSYMCVPKSEAKHDIFNVHNESCYSMEHTGQVPKKFDYTVTNFHTKAHSNLQDYK